MSIERKAAFRVAIKGIPTYNVAKALGMLVGSDWRGCTKDYMASCYANARAGDRMVCLSLEKLKDVAKKIA